MTKEQAHAVAAAWRGRGYDVRLVAHQGEHYALALLEDGQRWYVFTPGVGAGPVTSAIGDYAPSGSGDGDSTILAPHRAVAGWVKHLAPPLTTPGTGGQL